MDPDHGHMVHGGGARPASWPATNHAHAVPMARGKPRSTRLGYISYIATPSLQTGRITRVEGCAKFSFEGITYDACYIFYK